MKIKLLKPSYCGMYGVSYPVEVEAHLDGKLYNVSNTELARIGCDMSALDDTYEPFWPFTSNEVEVLP